MATQVQFRRGTTTQNNAFTGAIGEITYDTEIKTLRLHDGSNAGGGAVVVNTASAQTLTNKTLSTSSVWNGNAVALGYGGTGAALTAVAGAVAYSTGSALALSSAGTSGQVLTSGGSGAPTWVNAASITAGTATNATFATNINGGSAGQLVIQQDTGLTTFISAGPNGTFLRSAGAGFAPTWATADVTVGTTVIALGSASTTIAGLTAIDATSGATSFFATPTTPTLFNAGTGVTIGATTGTTTIRNATVTLANATTLNVNGANPTLAASSTGTLTLFNTNLTTVNAFGAATSLTIGATTGTATIRNSTVAITNNATVGGSLTVTGDLTVNGTTTTINATTITVDDKNIELGSVASPSNTTADGGGITLKGATDKTLNWINATGAWTSSEDFNLVTGKTYEINAVNVLDASSVLGSATTATLAGAATTLTIGATSGTATIRNSTVAVTNNATVGGTLGVTGTSTFTGKATFNGGYDSVDAIAFDYNFTGTTSGTTATAMTTCATATYRSGRLLMQVVNGSAYRILELFFVHDGTTVTLSENYTRDADIQTAATNTTFTASITSGTLTIFATAASGTSVIKGTATLFKV